VPGTVAAAVLGPPRDIETFARELEARGRARATVTRRLCTIVFWDWPGDTEIVMARKPA